MLGNLLRPWLLARLVASGTGAVLAIVVVVLAVQLLRAPSLQRTAEGQQVLDRRAELIAALTRAASWSAIVSLIVGVLGSDRLHGSLRGAMCAYGVLEATPYGFRSLVVSLVAAIAGIAWLALRRAGAELRRPVLAQAELMSAAALAPLFLADFVLSTLHATSLDFREVASCCSTGLEGARAVVESGGGPRTAFVATFFAASALAAVGGVLSLRAPTSMAAPATSALGIVALLAAPIAIATWVAPHVYGTPNHLCPFCLLHGDDGAAIGLGWPLYVALFVAVARSLSAGIGWGAARAASEVAGAEPERLAPSIAGDGMGAAVAWLVVLALAIAPWAFFAMESGGASLFG